MAGADATLWPTSNTRVDLRYAHVEDDSHALDQEESDDYASIVVRQRLGEQMFLTAEWNTLDASTRDVRASLDWELPDHDLSVFASYRYQDTIKNEFTTVYDPYTAVLGESFAWHQFDIQASKRLSENWIVDVGFTIRELDDDDDEGPFNREFVRGWATLTAQGWPTPELEVALTGEFWDGDADSAASAGFEVAWKATEFLRLRVGTYYSLYKYDLFIVDEREDATTLYLKARWRFAEDFRFDGRYEFETGDEGDYHTLWIGLTWMF
jgi:hypothetical protein